MTLKKTTVTLIFYFILTQVWFGQTNLETVYEQSQKKMSDDWQLDNSSGIPVYIAWKKERNRGINFIAYMEIENYNLGNLKKVFAAFSRQHKDALYINAEILTSKKVVYDEVTAKKKGYWSGEDLPEHLKSKERENLPTYYNSWYRAGYLRGKDIERITYYDTEKKQFKLINLNDK